MTDLSFMDELARRLDSPLTAGQRGAWTDTQIPDGALGQALATARDGPEPESTKPDVLPALTEPQAGEVEREVERFAPATVAGLIPYSHVKREPTIYLAREPIALPRAEVIVLYGPGGYGKGTTVADLAARVTRGELLLGGRAGSVIWIGYEDRPAQTMSWRLDAAGADDRFVFDMTDVPNHGRFSLDASGKTPGDAPLLMAKINALAEAARRGEISGVPGEGYPIMVVIDPLFKAIRGGTIRLGDGPGRVLAMLDEIARKTGVTIICPHHPDKGGKVMAGGAGIMSGARLVYVVEREDAEAGTYTISIEKTNGLDKATSASARYQIVGAGKLAHAIWLPPQATSAVPAWRVEAMEVLPPEAFEGAPVLDAGQPKAIEARPAGFPVPPSPYTAEDPEADAYAVADEVAEAEVVLPMIKAAFRKGGQAYTYSVDPDQEIAVGDRVAVSTPKGKAYADVTQIGSDYKGEPVPILYVVDKTLADRAETREAIDSNLKKLGART